MLDGRYDDDHDDGSSLKMADTYVSVRLELKTCKGSDITQEEANSPKKNFDF